MEKQSHVTPAVARAITYGYARPIHGKKTVARRPGQDSCDCSIGFFVLGGIGNLGNDASLAAMLATIRRLQPRARLKCICGDPERVTALFQIPAIEIESKITAGRFYRLVNRLSLRQLGHARNWYQTWRALAGTDVLLVPGTGVLDDFGVRPFGFPYRLLMWCTVAKLSGVRLAFVSAGAGPIEHPLSRRFMLGAARLADWRSYRDEVSRAYMEANGIIDVYHSVYPDLVFGLPLEDNDALGPPCMPSPSGKPKVVGIGVMSYYGWENSRERGAAVHARYIDNIVRLVALLNERMQSVHLLLGGEDRHMATELQERCRVYGLEIGTPMLELHIAATLDEHAKHIASTDIVVGTRYHTVIAALALARPTIALGYAGKFAAVMSDFGLQDCCQSAEHFEPEDVIVQIEALSDDYSVTRQRLAEVRCALRRRLGEQEQQLRELLPGAAA